MELPNISTLKEDAAYALHRGREPKDLVFWYALVTALIGAVLTLLNYYLGHQISSTGGLSGMGTRAFLSTFRNLLPILQTVALSCLQLGYQHGLMRICRRQYADRTDLKRGFEKAFPLIRLLMLQGALVLALCLLAYNISSALYLLTPWADSMMELIAPLAQDMTILDSGLVLSEEFLLQATPLVMPMLAIWLVILLLLLIPLSYRMRFSAFCLLDEPAGRAFPALRTSFRLTRRNCRKLFRIDLSFWWYYVLTFLASLLGYLDMLLPMFGIYLPINETLSYFLFYGVYLAASFTISYFFLNRVQSVFVMAYDSLREKPKTDGVVLGNIFDM